MSYKEQIDVAEQLLRKITIPALPTAVLELQKLFDKPETPNPIEVKKLVSANPYIAGELVGLANIPALTNSAHTKIKDIDSAIYRLGNKYIKNYVTAIVVKELLNTSKIAGLSYHSQTIANICSIIARYISLIRSDEAYLLGLLHDIGAFALAEFDENYGPVFVGKQANHYALEEHEIALFGTTHSALGYVLVKSWLIPNHISQTILLHHSTNYKIIENEKLKNLIALIELAHGLAIKQSNAKQENETNESICQESATVLGLSEKEIAQIVKLL